MLVHSLLDLLPILLRVLKSDPDCPKQPGVFVSSSSPRERNSSTDAIIIASLAKLIVYSIAPDGIPAPASTAPTPLYTPMTSGVSTPQSGDSVGEYLTVPLHKWERPKVYLGGSKALDSLARLIASTEHFFHPANSGSWTSDVRHSFRVLGPFYDY